MMHKYDNIMRRCGTFRCPYYHGVLAHTGGCDSTMCHVALSSIINISRSIAGKHLVYWWPYVGPLHEDGVPKP